MKNPFQTNDDEKPRDVIVQEAAVWLARRDRGLSAADQDAFLNWLHADPRHREALAMLQKTWLTLDGLVEWQPAHSTQPNPDLLAPLRRRRRGLWAATMISAGLAAAAVIAFVLRPSVPVGPGSGEPVAGVRVIPAPEREVLPDGSIVTIKTGGRYRVDFSDTERRVRLIEGELFVAVAKNPDRPFVIEVDGFSVRAIGTAFNVRRAFDALEVLVTEGRVQIEPVSTDDRAIVPWPVSHGERARLDLRAPSVTPAIVPVTPTEIARDLAWQSARLEFDALPLADVVNEFNLRNVQQVRVGDAETGRLRVAGTFRADQIESFVRLLEASYGLSVSRDHDGAWVLGAASAR